MSKGILIIAVGKPTYGNFAFNLASSIKHFTDLPVHLAATCGALAHLNEKKKAIFDDCTFIPDSELEVNGHFSPKYAKTFMYELSPFDETLYLDCDSLVISPLEQMFKSKKALNVFRNGEYKRNQRPPKYFSIWWPMLNRIYKHFEIDEEDAFQVVQTCFVYFRKNKTNESFFKKLKTNFVETYNLREGNEVAFDRIIGLYGGSMCDELAWDITLTQMNKKIESFKAACTSTRNGKIKVRDHLADKEVITYWGYTNTDNRFIAHYDKQMHEILAQMQISHLYLLRHLLKDKHVRY